MPSICQEANDESIKAKTIENIITIQLKNNNFYNNYLKFQTMLAQSYKPEWEFTSKNKYDQYIRNIELRTLNGDKVKSYEECEIANFLTINGYCA